MPESINARQLIEVCLECLIRRLLIFDLAPALFFLKKTLI